MLTVDTTLPGPWALPWGAGPAHQVQLTSVAGYFCPERELSMHVPRLSTLARAAGLGVALVVAIPIAPVAAGTAAKCGDTMISDIILANDLLDCAGDGLVVGANDITIDLNGHTVDGSGSLKSAGIRIQGYSGVIVKGGIVREFGRGIWLINAVDNQVLGNTIENSAEEGVFADKKSGGALVEGNKIIGNGIDPVSTWADGIDAQSYGATIRGNTVNNSRDDGIDANGNDVTIENNTMDGNGSNGIDVDGVNTTIHMNTGTNNGHDGIGGGLEADKVTLKGNITNNNRNLGINFKRGHVVDGGNNKAAGNADPRQCLPVKCA